MNDQAPEPGPVTDVQTAAAVLLNSLAKLADLAATLVQLEVDSVREQNDRDKQLHAHRMQG